MKGSLWVWLIGGISQKVPVLREKDWEIHQQFQQSWKPGLSLPARGTVHLSVLIIWRHQPTSANGGKAYPSRGIQLIWRASFAMANRSGLQLTY